MQEAWRLARLFAVDQAGASISKKAIGLQMATAAAKRLLPACPPPPRELMWVELAQTDRLVIGLWGRSGWDSTLSALSALLGLALASTSTSGWHYRA